jgi:hypothetical protein
MICWHNKRQPKGNKAPPQHNKAQPQCNQAQPLRRSRKQPLQWRHCLLAKWKKL